MSDTTLTDLRLLCRCESEGSCRLHGSASEQREMVRMYRDGAPPWRIARTMETSTARVRELLSETRGRITQ